MGAKGQDVEEQEASSILTNFLLRYLRLCRTAFWDSKLSEVHTSHHRSILDKMGRASTHPGMWSVLAYFELEEYLVLQ